jgi:hypothetical protein
MPPPLVYADECIQRPVVEGLRERGFNVVTALEAGRGQEALAQRQWRPEGCHADQGRK